MNPRIQKPAAKAGPTPAELLAKMPRRPMSAQQQAAALEKVQQQATQRVKLGQQLFEAAEAKLKQHQNVLEEINREQETLREKVQEDVAKSLQTYDQWMGRIDESFTKAIADLGGRMDVLESRVDDSRDEMQAMISKAAALLEQTQGLLAEAFGEESEIQQAVCETKPEALPDQIPHGMFGDDDESIASSLEDFDYAEPEDIDGPEVMQVEIIDSDSDSDTDAAHDDSSALEPDPPADGEDVFGEVLRRLRSQSDDDGHAAA